MNRHDADSSIDHHTAACALSRWEQFGWWLPLRFVLMVPLIPVLSLGNVAQELFDWLDGRLRV